MLNFLSHYITEHPLKMITYAEYMNLVLYHPKHGYYMREEEKIGRNGDYITTSNIADAFGTTCAKWFSDLVKNKSLSPHFCEIGAGNGRFAKAFLQEWHRSENPALTYVIIEKSPYHIRLQQEQFDPNWMVKYVNSIEELESFKGLIFSNELFDALPVHVIKKQNGQLQEIMVAFENGKLVERTVTLTNERILAFIEEHHISIAEGQKIEISLRMEEMMQKISTALAEGMVVTVDYGYTNDEWNEPVRRDGSLRGYYQHKQVNNVFIHPGEMDITSHIHWDALIDIGEKYGLETIRKWRQDEFLLSIGILDQLENHQDTNPFSEINKQNRAIRSLIMPSGISSAFHVLVQRKM